MTLDRLGVNVDEYRNELRTLHQLHLQALLAGYAIAGGHFHSRLVMLASSLMCRCIT